ncbi:MAG: hypothetical protein QF864_04060 [SAR202 cluster bacterium]|nr:hypothetical protein [SAR202 cluster bacterium]
MKKALLIGCGGKRGEKIIQGCHQANFDVVNIGSSRSSLPQVENYVIDWNTFEIAEMHKLFRKLHYRFDFIFFNQNASSLAKENFTKLINTLDLWGLTKDWGKSYWLSCQMPFVLIKTLESSKINKNTIIGWMLSSYIDRHQDGVEDNADYSGYKFTNYLIMKNFNKRYQCFGIDPEFQTKDKITGLIAEICSGQRKCNGEVF